MIQLPYGKQTIDDSDVDGVAEALRAPFLTQGPAVARFEEALANWVGARHAVAFNSGTAALHAAYFAAGIESGSSVLTSPITFVATVNAAIYLGGTAEFADVDAETVLLDPGATAQAASERTRVVVPVHFGGSVARMEEFAALAAERGWRVIEDAAHALGAEYQDSQGDWHRVGACRHSDACCFSFHPVKHITTGEGGAVTTNDEALAARMRLFRSHGITRDRTAMQRDEGSWYYEQHALGFNYRITDFQCVLGRSQLAKLDSFLGRRRALAARYYELLSGLPEIRPLAVPADCRSAYHLYVVRVPAARRRRIFDGLRTAGIGVNVHYIPVNRQPYHLARGGDAVHAPHADAYYAEAITLPLYPSMADHDVDCVTHELRRLLAT